MTDEKERESADLIHPTAIIDPRADIGKGVKIGPYAVIGPNVKIGDGTEIMSHVVIDGWTTIGKDCRFFPSASIGSEPQDLKFNGEKSYVIIGDRSVFREFVTVSRATGEGEETRIGNDCLFQACTHVAHNCIVGNHVIMSNCAGLAGHGTVEDPGIRWRTSICQGGSKCHDRRLGQSRSGYTAFCYCRRTTGAYYRFKQCRVGTCRYFRRNATGAEKGVPPLIPFGP